VNQFIGGLFCLALCSVCGQEGKSFFFVLEDYKKNGVKRIQFAFKFINKMEAKSILQPF